MKKILLKYLLGITIAVLPVLLFAQRNTLEEVSDTTDIKGQFEFLYKRSNTFEDYKVIRISWYNSLKQNSMDSIKMYQNQIINHSTKINELTTELSTKNSEIKKLSDKLAVTQKVKNNINFMGMEVTKVTYNTIMWGSLFCLVLISAILFSLYKRGLHTVKTTKSRLTEVQEDLENHRKNALVREQKLARELMDFKLKHKSGM